MTISHDAVVLAGGAGRRLGGVDKGALVVGAATLLEGVLAACSAATRTVVVGPARPTHRDVVWAREEPAGTGPLAALAAGVSALQAVTDGLRMAAVQESLRTGSAVPQPARTYRAVLPVVVLATDLAFVDGGDVDRLLEALDDHDAVVMVDRDGHRQPLAAVYARPALDRALVEIGDPAGRPVRLLFEHLEVAEMPDGGAAFDCDTPDQLAHARSSIRRSVRHGGTP